MSVDELKKWLNRYIGLQKDLKHIQEEIDEIRMTADGLKAQALTGMPSGSGGNHSIQEIAAIKMDDSIKRYALNAIEKTKAMEEIEEAISCIENPNEKDMMWLRYIKGLKWEEIACELHYSWRGIHKMHSRALKKMSALKCTQKI